MANPKLNRKRGKRAQKEIAKLLEALDIGIAGSVDLLNDDFVVEVKDKQNFVGEKFLEQAELYISNINKNIIKKKIPIAVVHIRGKPYKKSIVLIRIEDFLRLVEAWKTFSKS